MDNLKVLGELNDNYNDILTEECRLFLIHLHKKFNSTRLELLNTRTLKQKSLEQGTLPKFITNSIKDLNYQCNPLPNDLLDRRIEITGPVDRKMIINALNSTAKVFMADFEDSTSPTWNNIMNGQVNLRDAVNKDITYTHPKTGKFYQLNTNNNVTLMVRPRGWHLDEAHIVINNTNISASIFDFGVYFFHNVKKLLENNSGPYFYLPKLEDYLEARLWNNIFIESQNYLNIKQGTIKATVLCETILAAYQQDAIIYELKEHSAGLNCGRWDYIFSFIKKFSTQKWAILSNRDLVNMSSPWMSAYAKLLIKTCHKRNVHAMGGMAAQIPIKNDIKANNIVLNKIKNDKLREVQNGHDGSWVAHPGLIKVAMDVFDQHISLDKPNQIIINKKAEQDIIINESDLLDIGNTITITINGIKANISAGVRYLAAWLNGNGCVPLNHKMEDAATAEISRCQLWQWNYHQCITSDTNEVINSVLLDKYFDIEYQNILNELNNNIELFNSLKYSLAFNLFKKMIYNEKIDEFMTTIAYPYIIAKNNESKL